MKVSACLMVKNESETLPRCLESIKWVDEIIIVDTGSTDNTIEIAKSYKAKVYEHPWENDFSKHRNQSIGYATGDWILIIDADEEIEEKIDPKEFKSRLKMVHLTISALVVTVSEVSDKRKTTSWLGMRFFRRASGIHYKNAVHNKAIFGGGCAATDIHFIHYGYSLDPVKMAAKRKRTETLLKERLSMDETDFIAMYYLVQLYIGEKDYDKAEEYGLKFFNSVSILPTDFQYLGVMYFYTGWIYLHKRDGSKAYAWTKKGLEFFPDDLDLNYQMARIGWESMNEELLKTHSDKYFKFLPKIRNRGRALDSETFINAVNPDDWFNRTVYTVDISAEIAMRKYLEAA